MSVLRLPFRNFVIKHTQCIPQTLRVNILGGYPGKQQQVRVLSDLPGHAFHQDLRLPAAFCRYTQTFTPYDYTKHKPHMSMLRKGRASGNAEIPLAIKRGRPFNYDNNPVPQEFDPEEEIWVVKDPSYDWEPPTTDDGLLDSQLYQHYNRLLAFCIVNGGYEEEEPEDHPLPFIWPSDGDRIIKSTGLTNKLGVYQSADFIDFTESFLTAMATGWRNGDGKNAMNQFIKAAMDVCRMHADDLRKPVRPLFVVRCLGGNASRNTGNCHFAMKRVDPDILEAKGKNVILRDISMWVEPEDQEMILDTSSLSEQLANNTYWAYTYEQANDTKYWAYSYKVPDAFMAVYAADLKNPIGLLVGEVKSRSNSSLEWSEMQAFVQALKGLYFAPFTAALLMAPDRAVFQSIRIEHGFVTTQKKLYDGYSTFPTLFSDLILYLWNSYYRD